MVGPWLLGNVVEKLSQGQTDVDLPYVVLGFVIALLVQTVFVRLTRLRGAVLGEEMLADLREDFLVRAVGLPPGVLERAGTGDLLSRITTDIDRLSHAMRDAVPQLTIAVIWAGLLIGALIVTAPALAVAVVIAAPILIIGGRWYFRRAPRRTGRRRPGTRRSPRRWPRPSTPAGPSSRTGSATAGSSSVTPGSASGSPGSATRSTCG